MTANRGDLSRMGRWAAAAVAIGVIAVLRIVSVVQAQAPEIDFGQPPPQWGGSGYGYWTRGEEYQPTGRAGYIARLTSGEMVQYQGGETIVFNASLAVEYNSDYVLAGFGGRVAESSYCEPLKDGKPVAPQVEMFDGQFHGYPATAVEGYCRYPSYAYPNVTCDLDGNCAPDTSSGVQKNWEGGSTYLSRLTCFEATPGGPCTLVIEEIMARTSGPAALGENAEQAVFEALVAEVDAWKARWYIPPPGADADSGDVPLPVAPGDSGPTTGCETYCLNGVSVDSPFCDCAPYTPPEPPEPPEDDLLSLVIGLLAALGVIGGGGWVVTRLVRRRPKARPRPAPPPERVLVDALGRKHVFVRDEQGRYINPQTGGELNEAHWQEYNRNLVNNRKFSDREQHKQSSRDGAFDREMDQMVEEQKQVQRDLRAVQQMERNLLFNPDRIGLWRGPGEPGDMYTNLKELREQLSSGEEIDRRRLDAVRRLYRDHAQGTILTPDEMPSDMDFTRDWVTGMLDSTLREIATQQNSDGGFSYKSMGLRLLANVATLGQIEIVLTPMESVYTMHDYVQQGGDSAWEGFKRTAGDVIKGEIMSWLGEAGGRRLARLGKPKPQLPRARTPKTRAPSRYARASGVDIHPHMAGMPEANIRRAQQLAQKHNVQIMIRPTNPEARALLERGLGAPKPSIIKNKTISHMDTLLGANADDLGKVGHFKPKLPPKNSVPDDMWKEVTDRYIQRSKEFRNQAAYVKQLQQQGKAIERNGVLYEVLADGTPGKPFCGDHDLFEILDAHGNPCPESLKQHVVKELQKPPFSAQHPAHIDWDYSHYSRTPGPHGAQSNYDVAKGIDGKIRQSHGPGGEPLIKFQPGTMQPIEGSYYAGA